MVTNAQMRKKLLNACHGNISEWAEKHGFKRQYVWNVIYGNRKIPDKILKALGYMRKEVIVKSKK